MLLLLVFICNAHILFQIVLENRYKHDPSNGCVLGMDGTDFLIPEHGWRWVSHKVRKYGVSYDVVLSIWRGEVCWISGCYGQGEYNDL